MNIDANIVIDKLSLQVAQQAKEIAILEAQVEILKNELNNLNNNSEN